MKNYQTLLAATVLAIVGTGCSTTTGTDAGAQASQSAAAPMVIAEQGSFAVGGTVVTSPGLYQPVPPGLAADSNAFWDVYKASVKAGGQTLHGDHASVFYQIPANARTLPLVFLHGAGQSARSWQTTPDGREGFQNIFLRKRYPVYLIDQPRRGQAGRSAVASEIPAAADDQFWYAQFRIGVYPQFFEGVSFPKDPASMEQFFRQMTPDTGAFDAKVITDSMVKLFERSGDGVFVTHSAGGVIGWLTAMQSQKVKAIVAFEPGTFPFPPGETPAVLKSRFGDLTPITVDEAQFKRLTEIPIVIYFGDFISDQPSERQGEDQWYIRRKMAQEWVQTINRHGGRAQLVNLPEVGIHGNTHFPFSDLNNQQVAEHMAQWLSSNGLDR